MKRSIDRRHAFTLLELLAVVAILGLLATAVGSRIGGRGEARLRQAEQTLLSTDAWARRLAELQGRALRLRINLTDGTFRVEEEGSRSGDSVRQRGCPPGVTMERAFTAQEERSYGEVVIPFDRHGASGAYAVRFRVSGDRACWVVVAGGTGRPLVFDPADTGRQRGDETTFDDRDVEDFFRSLRKKRLDVD